jgi:competence protein ComEC
MVLSGHDRPQSAFNGVADSTQTEPAAPARRPLLSVKRLPLVAVAVSVAIGIVLDRYGRLPFAAYLAAASVAIAMFCRARRQVESRNVWLSLTLGFCCVGAMHHQLTLSTPEKSDLKLLLSDEHLLARFRGQVVGAPHLVAAPPQRWEGERRQDDLTRFECDCSGFLHRDAWIPISGTVQVDVHGLAHGLNDGDQIEFSGWAGDLPDRRNPGQRDVRASLLGRGLTGVVHVESPDLIQTRSRNPSMRNWIRSQLRSGFENTLKVGVAPDTLPVATALLLGDRSRLKADVRSRFVQSGAMHLLAISGMHVGIVAMFLFGLARFLRCSPRVATAFMLVALMLYIDAADARPPMIRAFVLIAIWGAGRLMNRPSFSANGLAAAALTLLAVNPTTLFDVGAQLSFLAVATIMWWLALGRRRTDDQNVDVAVAPDSPRARDALRPAWQRWLLRLMRHVQRPLGISIAVWLVSAPLTASTFQILAPIGILLNVILIPLVGASLCFGFCGLLLGLVSDRLADWPLAAFDLLLSALLKITELASQLEPGHIAAKTIPLWCLAGVYATVALAMLRTLQRKKLSWFCPAAVLWLLFGLVLPGSYAKQQTESLTCTVLSVGHGLSVVIELPNDRVLVYDCGSAGRPQYAAETLRQFLANRGITAVDGLIVSHSDADHFNGVEMLTEHVRIDRLLMSRHFPDPGQPGTIALIESADRHGIPIEIVRQGNRLAIDPSVSIKMLHPAPSDRFDSDNSASIVLEIEFAGRRILLTGDLEDDGLSKLLRQPPRDVDVLLAPHHGATAASPPELVEWARPRYVIASARQRFNPRPLESIYGADSVVMTTSRSGAVEFRVSPSGEVTVKPFLRD